MTEAASRPSTVRAGAVPRAVRMRTTGRSCGGSDRATASSVSTQTGWASSSMNSMRAAG